MKRIGKRKAKEKKKWRRLNPVDLVLGDDLSVYIKLATTIGSNK